MAKLRSVKARRGTRHWDYGDSLDLTREKKQLDPTRIFNLAAESEAFANAVLPIVENIYEAFGEATSDALGVAWNLRDPAVAADILARDNRLRGAVETTWNMVQEAIIDGEALGESIDSIAKRIGGVFNQAKGYRARVIARTETIGAANAGAFQGAVASGVVGQKVWLAAVDHRTRSTHVSADGQTVDLKKKFQVGASLMDHPGDPAGGPSEVINCRCSMVFKRTVPKDNDEEETVLEEETVAPTGKPKSDKVKPNLGEGIPRQKATTSIGQDVKAGSKPKRNVEPKNIGKGTKVSKGVEKAKANIDSVHSAPNGMPDIDVFQTSGDKTLGAYNFGYDGSAKYLQVSSSGADQTNVFAHEFGHYFDHQDFAKPGQFASVDAKNAASLVGEGEATGAELEEWWSAIEGTDTYQTLKGLTERGARIAYTRADGSIIEMPPDRAFVNYLLDPRELFARSYAQWIATETGDLAALEELAASRVRNPNYPFQWSEEEMEELAKAFRKVFGRASLVE